jgi:hypothetical protein
VDDYGNITLVGQQDGPYIALSESQILLDVRAWRPVVVAPVGVVPEVVAPEVVMPQLQSVLDEHHPDDEFESPDKEYEHDQEVSEVRREAHREVQVGD